ncbi:MAG: bifunctional methylenetetrahydrofolate dehydrogenase/methenyltetrahydrofolate cyclohydrolase FolD [Alphaproteobacteria bacterium]|nr:bifunctional methylenetetrahydrofolate dehydrogenase/methenyltetrahydrofolate cyclohydrolase FolD [Alphaproteobacteria bacterium]
MTAHIIDGKAFAATVRARVQQAASDFKKRQGIAAGLTVVLVGNDPASEIYVRLKVSDAREAGINSRDIKLPATATQTEVLDVVRELNDDASVHGVLVQFPVPAQIRQDAILDTLSPDKDVDGLTTLSAGRLTSGRPGLVSCTPQGCLMLIKSVRPKLDGLNAVVIGRSQLVGKPMSQLLLQENCTVTIAHSRSRDLAAIARSADILVAAVGRAEMVKGGWVKPGAIVIDVGMNRLDQPGLKPKLFGDVAFDEVKDHACAITPVPGGVGPMTRACLLRNTILAAFAQAGMSPPAEL